LWAEPSLAYYKNSGLEACFDETTARIEVGQTVNSVTVIADTEFQQQVLEATQPVLAYFWAPWCGPCRLVSPSVEAIAAEYGDRLRVVKLEVDPNPVAVKHCQVEGVPALRLFKAGQVVAAREGALAPAALREWLNAYLD